MRTLPFAVVSVAAERHAIERDEGRADHRQADGDARDERDERRVRGGRLRDRQAAGQQSGVLRDAPPDRDRGDGDGGAHARAVEPAGPHQCERRDAGGGRGDHAQQARAAGQPGRERGRVRVHHDEPADRDRAGDDAGHERARTEPVAQIVEAQALGVGGHVDGGEMRREDDREHARDQRRGLHPGRERRPGAGADRHAARGDCSDRRAEEERRQDRGQREGRAQHASFAEGHRVPAEGVRRPAQDDSDAGEEQRHVERGHHGAERARERRPEHDQDEDQPDVIGLPHRRHRALHEAAHARAALGATGDEVPEPRAEVRPGEHRVGRQPRDDERGADLGEAHRAISARRRMAASASCAGRERRRRSHPTAIASPMYVSARSA